MAKNLLEVSSQDMRAWASDVFHKRTLTEEQVEISESIDEWARKIGSTGNDSQHEIAAYIQKTLESTVDETLDEVMEMLFDIGAIGEFDKTSYYKSPKNTLIAFDSAIGGNVPKSYIDVTAIETISGHAQVETQIRYIDLRKDGFKSIAQLTTFAEDALKQHMYSNVFNAVAQAVAGGSNVITESTAYPTIATMDKLSLNIEDTREDGDEPIIVTSNLYAQAIARLDGLNKFLSDSQKEEYAKRGFASQFASIPIKAFSNKKKMANGNTVVPEKTILGVAGKIGELNLKGDIRVYETMDNNNEKIDIKITGLAYEFAILELDKVSKITVQG